MSDPMLFPIGDIASNYDPNPMIVRHGPGPDDKTCHDCRQLTPNRWGTNRTYWKCRRRGITHGQGTDHRKKWHACRLYEPRGDA